MKHFQGFMLCGLQATDINLFPTHFCSCLLSYKNSKDKKNFMQ